MVWFKRQARRKQTVNASGCLSMCLEGNTSSVNNTQTYLFYAKYNTQSGPAHSPDFLQMWKPDNKKLRRLVLLFVPSTNHIISLAPDLWDGLKRIYPVLGKYHLLDLHPEESSYCVMVFRRAYGYHKSALDHITIFKILYGICYISG